jgi:hypothetical protein
MGLETCQPESKTRSRAAHLDELLDEALEETFPASDPVAIDPKWLEIRASGTSDPPAKRFRP